MPPFAPKLTSEIGYTQPLAAPAAEPNVLSGIGDVFSGALDTVEKAFDANKPKAPSYQQLKDEDELRNFNVLQVDMERAVQLRDQGHHRKATDMEYQAAIRFGRMGGDITDPSVRHMVELTSGRSFDNFGMNAETRARIDLENTEEWRNNYLASFIYMPDETSPEERKSKVAFKTMEIIAAKQRVAAVTAESEAQAAENHARWDEEGGDRSKYHLLMDNFLQGQIGAVKALSRNGTMTVSTKSIETSLRQWELFKAKNIAGKRPRGITEAQWSNVTNKATAIDNVFEGLLKRGDDIRAETATNFSLAVLRTGLGVIGKYILMNSSADLLASLDAESMSELLKAVDNLNLPVDEMTAGNPSFGSPRDKSNNTGADFVGSIPRKSLDKYTGDPDKLISDMDKISRSFGGLQPNAVADNISMVANVSLKMAASVHNSAVPFGAVDIKKAYNTGLVNTIRKVADRDPQTALAMSRQHVEALNNMAAKAYQNARRTFGDSAILGVDGIVKLDWERAFDKFPTKNGFREIIKGHMKDALKQYDGNFYKFTKAYRRSKQAGKVDYSEGQKGGAVSLFMNSQDMSKFMQEGGELEEQMNSLVAINAARSLMKKEADLVEKTYSTAVDVGDEFTQDVTSDAIPEEVNDRLQGATTLDEIRALGEQQRDTMSSILDAPPFPRERPVEGGVLGRVGRLGAVAGYILNALIPDAAAGTLSPAQQIENMDQSSYNSKLKEYVSSYEVSPQIAKDAGYVSEYDVPVGYGRFDDSNNPPKALTNMTFTEVFDYQKTLIKNSKGKLKNVDPSLGSSAVGRWQIIGPTLKRLKIKLGLQDSDKFTKSVQDQMFNILLDEAGQAKFKQGKITANQFQDNLSKIWASIPNSKGVSTYSQPAQSATVPLPTSPVPRQRPSGIDDELPENQIMDTVLQTVPDARPEEVKEAIDRLQGTITLDEIRALGAREKAIMSSILDAPPVPRERPVSEEEQQQPTFAPKLTSDTGYTQDSYLYRPTPTPMGP